MSFISSNFSNFIQQFLLTSTTNLFPRERLEKIAQIFDISSEKIQQYKNNNWGLQDKCFKKIVRACEDNKWEKINAAENLIFGIRDSKGRTIFDLLTDENSAPPNFCLHKPEILVFQGGGPKGIAYIGVLEALEERNMLQNVKRVGGSSAGAITATLVALGCTSKEAWNLLTETPLSKFRDFSCCQGGFYKGEAFLNWVNHVIKVKTGIKNCTFGQLNKLISDGLPFKHLHVFAKRSGENIETIYFSSEDKQWDDLIIADTVRASMSIPLLFQPHILHFKNSYGGREPHEEYGSFMDGGILANLPIEHFDRKKYLPTKNISKEEKDYYLLNKRVLGFSLYDPGEDVPKPNAIIKSICGATCDYVYTLYNAEINIRKSVRYNKHRIVKINNMGIGLFDFELTIEKMYELADSGRAATTMFLQEQEIKLYQLSCLEKRQRISSPKVYDTKLYISFRYISDNGYRIAIEILGDKISIHTEKSVCTFLDSSKQGFSFELLAQHDPRFMLFVYINNQDYTKADEIFLKHTIFFQNCFLWSLFINLLIENNRGDYIRFFVKKGFSFHNRTHHPLWYAYKHNAFEAFDALLKSKPLNLMTLENSGQTLLHVLIENKHNQIAFSFCRALKEKHPASYLSFLSQRHMLERPYYSPDPLDIAVNNNNSEVAEFLIEEGVEFESKIDHWAFMVHMRWFDITRNEGNLYRPRMVSRKSASYDFIMKVFGWEFRRKISPQMKMQLLDYCCGRWLSSCGEDAIWELIVSQILPFPKWDLRDINSNSPSLIVLKSPNFSWEYKLSLMKLLLYGQYPDDVNQANNEGETPLILASRNDFSVLQFLLERDEIDVNHQDNYGNTALHYAVAAKGKRRINALTYHKNIKHIPNNEGKEPIDLMEDICTIS